MTGILLYAADAEGNPVGPFWHTTNTREGRPLGLIKWRPDAVRTFPFGNHSDGEIDVELLLTVHVVALFWQYAPGEFPQNLVMNLYFNGDNATPGISALIPYGNGLTQFRENTAPSTLTLYLGDTENAGGLFFDDGSVRARLGAVWYMPSAGPTDAWRPSDFADIDRVGDHEFKPDGQPDGIVIFELTAGPTARPPKQPVGKGPKQPFGYAAEPPIATVGSDQWVVPDTPTLPSVPPTAPATAAPTSVPDVVATAAPGETDVTPSPAALATTSPAVATVTSAAAATPTPKLAASRQPTHAKTATPEMTPGGSGEVR